MAETHNIAHNTTDGAIEIQDGRRIPGSQPKAARAKPSQPVGFVIFTDDGGRHHVEALSLRRAVRDCGIDERKTRIVAAVAADCLPTPETEARPFLAVFLDNPRFVPPELP